MAAVRAEVAVQADFWEVTKAAQVAPLAAREGNRVVQATLAVPEDWVVPQAVRAAIRRYLSEAGREAGSSLGWCQSCRR